MAIVQISRITHRKGLSENIPQLAGAEFGWVIDQRRLFIGNGTLQEGAPAIGNTEILTQYSDIFEIAGSYTYKGQAGGYTVQTGPTSGDPVLRTLQDKLDDTACVKDFGATGDGVTDDTDAINRALFQLLCRQSNPQVRRSLFFPAGVYRITNSINIPPFVKLYGEGGASSIIKLDVGGDSAYGSYVARTADSLQQTGASIGQDGATAPNNIEIYNMGFQSSELIDIFYVQNATDILFHDVHFTGPFSQSDIANDPGTVTTADIACVRFDSTLAFPTQQITFEQCKFAGCTYAVNEDNAISGVTISNSELKILYQGVLLGTGTPVNGGPSGFRLMHNLFDSISQEGVIIGSTIENNMTGFNIFLDVGNEFQGLGNPSTPIIVFNADNNVSVGDMFERDENDNAVEPRIQVDAYKVFALDKGERYKFGTYTREAGDETSLTPTNSPVTCVSFDVTDITGITLQYSYKDGATLATRIGTMQVVKADGDDSTGTCNYTEEFTESTDTTLVLSALQSGNNILIKYVLPTGGPAIGGRFKYSISHQN